MHNYYIKTVNLGIEPQSMRWAMLLMSVRYNYDYELSFYRSMRLIAHCNNCCVELNFLLNLIRLIQINRILVTFQHITVTFNIEVHILPDTTEIPDSVRLCLSECFGEVKWLIGKKYQTYFVSYLKQDYLSFILILNSWQYIRL